MDQIVTGGGGAPIYTYVGEPDVRGYIAASPSENLRLEHLMKPGATPAENPNHFVLIQVDGDRLSLEVIGIGALRPLERHGAAAHDRAIRRIAFRAAPLLLALGAGTRPVPLKKGDDGVWTVTRGMLRAELPDDRQEHSMLYAGDSTWTNYALDVDVGDHDGRASRRAEEVSQHVDARVLNLILPER